MGDRKIILLDDRLSRSRASTELSSLGDFQSIQMLSRAGVMPRGSQQSVGKSWFNYFSFAPPIAKPAELLWPPPNALRFVRSERFLQLLEKVGKAVIGRMSRGNFDVYGATAIAFEWFDRKAGKDATIFDRFSSQEKLAGYLYRFLHHEVYRIEAASVDTPGFNKLDVPDDATDPLDHLIAVEFAESAARRIEALPARERLALRLRLFEGLTNNETAHKMGVTKYAASRNYANGIKKLAKNLEKFAP